MLHKDIDTEGIGDSALHDMIQDNLPKAPADEWFTRKVMNRLPDKQAATSMGLPEKLCYIAGVLLLMTGWGYAIGYMLHNGLTMSALIVAAIFPIVALFGLFVFAVPAIKRIL